jgi:hypothetical protein
MEGHRSPNRADLNSCTNAIARRVTRTTARSIAPFDRSMIGAIDRIDKSCSPAGDIAVRKHLSPRE